MKNFLKEKQDIIIGAVALIMLIISVVLGISSMPRGYRQGEFNSSTVSAFGGKRQENANLNKIDVIVNEGSVQIDFSFVSGSESEGETSQCGIPEYKVEFLQGPARMLVTFTDVVYYDYVVTGVETDITDIIIGMFRNGGSFYFNLSSDVEFLLTENGGTLSVVLRKKESDDIIRYYLTGDLYYEYQNGQMPECGFTPTLCSDNMSVVMISKGYKTREQAEKEKDSLLTGKLEGFEIDLQELKGNQLPVYNEESTQAQLLSESIVSINGAKISLPLFFGDARFLCWCPNNTSALFAKAEDGVEKLYVADREGTKHQLSDKTFSTITKAAYSADGSVLAIVDNADDVERCSVYDVEQNTLKMLVDSSGESLLGENILGLTVSDDGMRVYSVSGKDVYSLKEYDVLSSTVRELKTQILVETDLKYFNGNLYYNDVYEEREMFLKYSIDSDSITPIAAGASFTMSPDGLTAAVISENYETAVCDLNIVNIESGEVKTVLGDAITNDYFFSNDGKKLYYVLETGDEEFYYQIISYDIQTGETEIKAQSINASFFASNMPEEVIISVMYEHEGSAHSATYIASLKEIVQEEYE